LAFAKEGEHARPTCLRVVTFIGAAAGYQLNLHMNVGDFADKLPSLYRNDIGIHEEPHDFVGAWARQSRLLLV
jgi:hypothetical protein